MSGFEDLKKDFKGKRVLILGLGLLGRGLGDTILFSSIGSQVRVTDLKTEDQLATSLSKLRDLKISYTLGEHKEEDIEWADVILRNASVPWNHPLLEKARSLGKQITMDSQLFVEYAPVGVKIIGVTGTRGKTTTSMLIAHVLKHTTQAQVILGGNVRGIATLPQLKTIQKPENTFVVLELSSWQLQAFGAAKISPDFAVVTNIYPDHLNSYTSMDSYIADKKQIFLHQNASDRVWLNASQKMIMAKWKMEIPSQLEWFSVNDVPEDLGWQLVGKHNRENAAACLAVCQHLQVTESAVLGSIQNFSPIENRLQQIASINQADVYNDSNSTTPTATIKALESFDTKVSLILGGEDKKLPVSELVERVNQKAKRVYLLHGSGSDRIADGIDKRLISMTSDKFDTLVNQALADLTAGEILVFSPGFTSFNMFENEYDRGDTFSRLVQVYAKKKKVQASQNQFD